MKDYNPEGLKWCTRCLKYQPAEVFKKRKEAYDGLNNYCSGDLVLDYNSKLNSRPNITQTDLDLCLLPMANTPYKYKRPDAYEQYIASVAVNHISISDYKPL